MPTKSFVGLCLCLYEDTCKNNGLYVFYFLGLIGITVFNVKTEYKRWFCYYNMLETDKNCHIHRRVISFRFKHRSIVGLFILCMLCFAVVNFLFYLVPVIPYNSAVVH